MPFRTIDELPARVKTAFPGTRAREVFVRAFNTAHAGTCRTGGQQGDREACSFAIATAAAAKLRREDRAMNTTQGIAKLLEGLGALLGASEEEPIKRAKHPGSTSHDDNRPCPPGQIRDEKTGACRPTTPTEARAQKGDRVKLERTVPIVKVDDVKHLIASVVYEPEVVDAHGDGMTAEEIERSCHGFGIRYAQGHGELGTDHLERQDRASIVPVESYLAPVDFQLGDQLVKAGSWVMVSKVFDPKLWDGILDGTYTGYSFEGWGSRVLEN